MRARRGKKNEKNGRRGVAATELAVVLPLFVMLFVIAVDFGRVFYVEYIVINAARCGAMYGSTSPTCAQDSTGIQQKILAETKDLDPKLLQIISTPGTDSSGNPCIDVTVNYPFTMVTSYLIATNLNVASRIRLPVSPVLPAFN
jgi:Flp pilus assembly protein TadG